MVDSLPLDPSWPYALVGGAASIPLTILIHNKTGSGIEFSSIGVVFGGILAGYLARRDSIRAGSAGTRAGLVGVLPLFYWWTTVLQYLPIGLEPFGLSLIADIEYQVQIMLVILWGSLVAGLLGGWIVDWTADQVGSFINHETGH